MLHSWVKNGHLASDKASAGSRGNSKKRKAIATQLAKHIHLEWIDPTVLSTTVASSGLFNPEQLANAYKLQAIAAQKEHNVPFKRARLMRPVWKRSQSKIIKSSGQSQEGTDLIDHPPILSGKYKWTVEIERETSDYNLSLGVALMDQMDYINYSEYDDWLGRYTDSWLITSDLEKYVGGNEDGDLKCHDMFGPDDRITLVLDLLPGNERKGTLSFSVNDGESVSIFDNLLNHLEGDRGFVPAVSFSKKCIVRLLNFERYAKTIPPEHGTQRSNPCETAFQNIFGGVDNQSISTTTKNRSPHDGLIVDEFIVMDDIICASFWNSSQATGSVRQSCLQLCRTVAVAKSLGT